MSRAFVREPDGDQVRDEVPELAQEPVPNYVTPEGLAALESRREALRRDLARHQPGDDGIVQRGKRAHMERDLRYVDGRIEHAVVVDPARQPRGEVAFGATVRVGDENGDEHVWRIVGDNQADFGKSTVSWASPLARALIGARVGDVVTWCRPAGDMELEVIAISYDGV